MPNFRKPPFTSKDVPIWEKNADKLEVEWNEKKKNQNHFFMALLILLHCKFITIHKIYNFATFVNYFKK